MARNQQPYIILWLEQSACEGIHVGHCIAQAEYSHRLSSSHNAHAHNDPHDPYNGWICCRPSQASRLSRTQPEYNRQVNHYILTNANAAILAWHELAHLTVNSQGHGLQWRSRLAGYLMEYMPDLGPTVIDDESYGYHRRNVTESRLMVAAGYFLVGQRVRIQADAKHPALVGQLAHVVKVNRSCLVVRWDRPEAIPTDLRRYLVWPARLIEPLERQLTLPEPTPTNQYRIVSDSANSERLPIIRAGETTHD